MKRENKGLRGEIKRHKSSKGEKRSRWKNGADNAKEHHKFMREKVRGGEGRREK